MYFVPSYLKLKSFKVPEKNSILYSYTYMIYLSNLLFTLFQIKRNVLSYIIEALCLFQTSYNITVKIHTYLA